MWLLSMTAENLGHVCLFLGPDTQLTQGCRYILHCNFLRFFLGGGGILWCFDILKKKNNNKKKLFLGPILRDSKGLVGDGSLIQRHAHWIWRRDLRTQQWPPQGRGPGREGPPLQPRATRTIQTSASQTVRPTCLPRGNSSTACDLGAVPTSVFCLTAWPPSRLSHVASRCVTWPCAASRGLAQRHVALRSVT